jgi:hypothetical protein
MDGDSPSAYTRWLHGSTERMRLTAGGNVGIGTTSPSTKLNISSASFNDHITLTRSTDELGISVSGGQLMFEGGVSPFNNNNEDLGRSDKYWKELFVYSVRSGGGLQFKTSGNNERMRITSAGNVGIGTTSPSSKLQVAGGIQMADDTDTASADKVGTMRYRTGTEYVEVTGTELITNGDFTTDSDWTLTANVAISGGKLNFTNAVTNTQYASQSISAPISSVYRITLDVSNLGSGESVKIRFPFQDTSINANGTYTIIGTGTTANAFRITPNSSTATFSIDNISVMEVAEEDASYADMCMQTGASTYEWVNIVRNTY